VGEASLFLFKAKKYITTVPIGYKTNLVMFFFDENGYVALSGILASQNQKVTTLKKVGDL
jgi:hypothetical protein